MTYETPNPKPEARKQEREKEFLIDNLLVRIHFIIVMILWTGLAPWEFEFPFPGSLTSTFLSRNDVYAYVFGRFYGTRNPKPGT